MKPNTNKLIFSGGTTIITAILFDSIWMASDSRETNFVKNRSVSYSYHNKIKNYKNVFYAIAGYPTIWNASNNALIYNSYDIMNKALDNYKSIDSAINYFKFMSKHKLDSIFKANYNQSSLVYAENPLHLFMDVAVVKFAEKNKKIFFFTYYIDFTDGNFIIRIKDISFNSPAYIHKMGYYDHIEDTMNNGGFKWDTEKSDIILNSLIELEKKNHNQVGGTVDVVMIYNDGFRWFSNNKY